ncbi:FG-GAP repeat domain-containing protein [Methylorubrum suomiense]
MANDTPRLIGLSRDVTFAENTVNATPQRLDTDVSLIDVDFGGGTLTVSGLLAEDRVGIATDDVISLSGTAIRYNGTVIGQLTGGQGNTLTVLFNAAATTPAVEAVIEHLTYANHSDAPTPTRTLTLDVVDALGGRALAGFIRSSDGFNMTSDGVNTIYDAPSPFAGIDVGLKSKPAFADLNGDGHLDLVVGDQDGMLRSYLRNVDGTFTQAIGAADPFAGIDVGSISSPAFADLNGDGRLDLVVGGFDGMLRSYLRNADGTFTQATGAADPFAFIDVGAASAPALGDLNGDGRLDLVVGESLGAMQTYLGNADGTFTRATGVANPSLGTGPNMAPVLSDVNGDGRLDIIVGSTLAPYRPTLATRTARSPEPPAPPTPSPSSTSVYTVLRPLQSTLTATAASISLSGRMTARCGATPQLGSTSA